MNKTINIATWNLHYCIELNKILNNIRINKNFANIDFLMLQEVSLHDGIEDASLIANHLGEDYTYFQATAQTLKKDIPQANALIWNKKKIEIDCFDIVELPPLHKGSRLHIPYKKIFDKEHKLVIFLRNVLQKRISLLLEGKIYKKTFRIYVVHFDIVGFATKKRQMSFILEDSNQRKNVDIEIIAGDLNTFKYFNMPQWKSIKESTEKAGFVDLTTNIKWTFSDSRFPKTHFARHKLDTIFIRDIANPTKLDYQSWSLDISGSDHIPVFAKITLS